VHVTGTQISEFYSISCCILKCYEDMPPLKPNSELGKREVFIKRCCPSLGLCSADSRLNNVKGNDRIVLTDNRNTWEKMLVSLCSPQIPLYGQVAMGKNFVDSRIVLY